MAVTKEVFPSREAWLKARKNHIGGSDAASCIGMNPYKDNVTLWEEKMGYWKTSHLLVESADR
mgnify:CR=1 FL=1